MKAIIFDTETTGLLKPSIVPVEKQPQIIEVGAILVDCSTLKIEAELSQIIKPSVDVPEIITKITGITNADVEGKPSFLEFLPVMKQFFADVDTMICHNAPFDSGMLRNDLTRAGCEDFPWPTNIICTVSEFLHVFGRRAKMTELYENFCGKPLEQTHRALDDVKALHEILVAAGYYSMLEG